MKIKLWGVRGSLPISGKSIERYGGNTSCIEVRGNDGSLLVLDAGTGIRLLGTTVGPEVKRLDLLLTHLHMDHILGLGFFSPLFRPDLEVHIWGPPSTTMDLHERLSLYLSPPLFPVRLRDLKCKLTLHSVPLGEFEIGPFRVHAALIIHPDPTVGYRISEGKSTIAFMPDHEPFLGCLHFPDLPEWTSGYELAQGVDLLIHDAQYTEAEYSTHMGWGHSSIEQTIVYAEAVGAKKVIAFHHNPSHDDDTLDQIYKNAKAQSLPFILEAAVEGAVYQI